jgi:hypothetical protein
MGVSISKPVTKIFNKSMEEKKLLKIWKIANITPIHKKGHKYDVPNYRPITSNITFSNLKSVLELNVGNM